MKFSLDSLKLRDGLRAAALSALLAANVQLAPPATAGILDQIQASSAGFVDQVQANAQKGDFNERYSRFSKQTQQAIDATQDAVGGVQEALKDPEVMAKNIVDQDKIKEALSDAAGDVGGKVSAKVGEYGKEAEKRIAKNTGELNAKLEGLQDAVEDMQGDLGEAAPVVMGRAQGGMDRSLKFTQSKLRARQAELPSKLKGAASKVAADAKRSPEEIGKALKQGASETGAVLQKDLAPLAEAAAAAGSAVKEAGSAVPDVVSKAGEVSSTVVGYVAENAQTATKSTTSAAKSLVAPLSDAPEKVSRFGAEFSERSSAGLKKKVATLKAIEESELADSVEKMTKMGTSIPGAVSAPSQEALEKAAAQTKQVAASLKVSVTDTSDNIVSAAKKKGETVKKNVKSTDFSQRYAKFQKDTEALVDTTTGVIEDAKGVLADAPDPEVLKAQVQEAGKNAKKVAKKGAIDILKKVEDSVGSMED